MDSLADIALAFAKEVLGWEGAWLSEDDDGCSVIRYQEVVAKDNEAFDVGDLNQVMPTARKFSDNLRIQSQYRPPHWYAEIWIDRVADGKGWLKGSARHDDLCAALMSAFEAARKGREG